MRPARTRLPIWIAAATLLAGSVAACSGGGPGEERAPQTARRSEAQRPAERERSSRPEREVRARGVRARWSDTEPPINLTHLFEGQVNKRGKPVGFHARPGGVDPEGARLVRVVDGPDRAGVYIANVEIRGQSERWLEKTSTLFPDDFTSDEVQAAILAAFERSGATEKWRGDSGRGFTIEGYYQNGRINTAYPIFRGSGRR